jgi:hypothetical protein
MICKNYILDYEVILKKIKEYSIIIGWPKRRSYTRRVLKNMESGIIGQ